MVIGFFEYIYYRQNRYFSRNRSGWPNMAEWIQGWTQTFRPNLWWGLMFIFPLGNFSCFISFFLMPSNVSLIALTWSFHGLKQHFTHKWIANMSEIQIGTFFLKIGTIAILIYSVLCIHPGCIIYIHKQGIIWTPNPYQVAPKATPIPPYFRSGANSGFSSGGGQ